MPHRSQGDSEPGSLVYQAQHDLDGDPSLSTSILQALDSATDYDVEASETVIFDYVDPDALDDLFTPITDGDRNGQVRFTIDQYAITATAAGEIMIRERAVAADD